MISVLELTIDGQPGIYSLDDDGSLVQGADIQASDCKEPVEAAAAKGTEATAAVAPTPLGTKIFTVQSPTYSKSDTQGSFTGQFTPGQAHKVAFSYRISAALQAIISGSVYESVTRTPGKGSCYDIHGPVAKNYLFHWSCGNKLDKKYVLDGSLSFPVNVGGNPGTGQILWRFNYEVAGGGSHG